jgi:sigma-E factor negative regulatory protein RseC
MSGFICSFINTYGTPNKKGVKAVDPVSSRGSVACFLYRSLYKGVIMVSEQGIIEKITDRKATVRVRKSIACAQCSSRTSCNISDRDIFVEVQNDLQARVGDLVEISIPEGTMLKLSVIVYLFPIISLMIGAFLGGFIANFLQTKSSWPAIISGVIFLGLAFCVLKMFERKKMSGGTYYPRMTRIVANAAALQPCDNK